MLERQFIISVTLIFPVLVFVLQRLELSPTSLSTLLHWQPLLWCITLLSLRILLKNKEIRRDGGITGLMYVTEIGGYLMEVYESV